MVSRSQIHASHNLTEPTASKVTPQAPKRTTDILGTTFRAPKLEIVPKPIEVIVKLSEKSFISPIFGAETDRYDICINFFYNGEFNASQIIEYSDWAADERKTYFNFGGRRIEACHELPWMITTKSEHTNSSISLIGKSPLALTPLERWNKVAEMLLLEANEWGRDERGYRYPTGEYLEFLSRKAMPTELDRLPVSTGSGFGVIDVVITLGHMSRVDAAKEIDSPRRNLPASLFQETDMRVEAHIGSRIATPSSAPVIDLFKNYQPRLSNLNTSSLEVDPKNTPRYSSMNEMPYVVTASLHQQDQTSSSALEVVTPTADVIPHSAGSQAFVRRATSMTARIPAALAGPATPRPPHPHRPKNVPQKRYRGSEPVLPPSPPSKRLKIANLFEELPFDLNTAAYMSTRARRSASMPIAQTSSKPQPESAIKRKRGVNQVKSALSNAELSETQIAGTPLTPEQDKKDNPKTPEFGGLLKKKPRSSNYNPKLSNRPQNLRRKNSAGEWIIPQCRKNSSGEWETPTKGGQAKSASLGEHTDGTAPGGNEKIFQPVFTVSEDNTSRNMAIGPTTPHGISLDKNKLTLKGNIHPSNSAGRTNQVTIAAIATKFTNSPPNVAFQGVKGTHTTVGDTQARELLVASPTGAAAAAFDNYFKRKKKDTMVISSKNKPQKKTLRIRFFQGNISSDGEIVGDGCGKRRLLVRRCATPEHTPAPGSGKKPTSYPLFENSKSFSPFATGPHGAKFTNVVTDSALKTGTRSRFESSTGHDAESSIANNSAIATLRGSRMGTPRQHQNPDTSQRRPRFVIPNHNSRVLKLVRRQGVATETDVIKQEAQDAFGEAVFYNPVNGKVGIDATKHVDERYQGDSSAFATNGDSPNIPQRDTGLKGSSAPQSINDEREIPIVGCADILAQETDASRGNDSGVQVIQEGKVSTQMPAGRTVPKRPFRPRTVGPTELKALLESHDRHNVVDTALGAPLGVMHSQLMTRASRKAISFKPRKVISSSEVVTDTQVSSDKPTVRLPVTGSITPRKRSSSGQFIVKTAMTVSVQRNTKDTDGGLSEIVDAQASGKAISGASSYEVKMPFLGNKKKSAPKPSIMNTMGCNLSLLGAGEPHQVIIPKRR